MSKVKITKKSPKHTVGYRRPPKAHQFKPGQSGNPKGRPRGAPTLQEVMSREASRLVKVKQDGEIVSIPKLVALVRQVFSKALNGDLSAARLIIQLTADPTTAEAQISEDVTLPSDEAIQRMLKRFEHLTLPKGSTK